MTFDFSNSVVLLIDLQALWTNSEVIQSEFPEYRSNTRKLVRFARAHGLELIHIYVDCVPKKSMWLNKCVEQWNRFTHLPSDVWYLSNNQPDATLVQPLPSERVFIKHNFDAFTNPKLNEYLQQRSRKSKVKTVYVCGLISSVCVINTINGSLVNGYETCAIHDCCADFSRKVHDTVLFDGYERFIKHYAIGDGTALHERVPVPVPISIPHNNNNVEKRKLSSKL